MRSRCDRNKRRQLHERTSVNLVAVLITGLFAGGISCAAVQGGLLTGLITRQQTAGDPATTAATSVARQPNPPLPPDRDGQSRPRRARLAAHLTPAPGFLTSTL